MKAMPLNTTFVRAILDGRKTVIRLVIKPQPTGEVTHCTGYKTDYHAEIKQSPEGPVSCKMRRPYCPGDILYVQESWSMLSDLLGNQPGPVYMTEYTDKDLADLKAKGFRWKPSTHLPTELARIFLRVTSVRAQRLHDMLSCRDEMLKEGLFCRDTFDWETSGQQLKEQWDGATKTGDKAQFGWDANPWVWAVEFERISKEDALSAERGGQST